MRPPSLLIGGRLGAMAGLVANGFSQAAASLALVWVVDLVASGGLAGGHGWLIAAASLFLGITLFVLRVMQRRQGAKLALGYVREVRGQLVRHLLALPPSASRTRLGLVMTRLITDLSAIRSWLADGIASFLVAGPSIILIALGGFWLAPSVAPYLLSGILLWLAITILTLPFLQHAIRESRRWRGRLAGHLGEVVLGRTSFAHFGRSGPVMRKVDRESDRMNAWLIRRASWSGVARAASELVTPAMIAILVGYAVAAGPAMPVADLSALLLLSSLIVAYLSDLARAADYRLAYVESRRRIASILAMPVLSDPEMPMPLPRTSAGRRLCIEHRPDGGSLVVLKATPGELVLLCGGTRTSRSAFLASVAGLEEDADLSVFLDGVPLHQVSRRDWRRAVSLLSPAIPLVRGTAMENIVIGAPSGTSQEEIGSIAKSCRVDADGGSENPQLHTRASHAPSPAQASRIRAARAMIRSASVLLIDDDEVCNDQDLLDTIIAYARAAQSIVIVSCQSGETIAADKVWLLDRGSGETDQTLE
ncbi:ABC transporter transmembrane domain-containing protein [Chelativorans salis]|uniref:ABC transporter ATP-binding protein/permease n=1 Tax=Chelativorans salis TaxID=2978478 RepID=A0ABT2LTI3_9HYPH|nr:ABC transporter ATP-binding protein [Chelativorans sp. EGI FJ00035]MCT7377846.1 ABC transporter ATP-binding protein/permease [Chelativorans sp. EGI FJ00035]